MLSAARISAGRISAARIGAIDRATAVGACGSVLIAVSSWSAGALPASFRTDPPQLVEAIGVNSPAARAVFYLGVALLAVGWLWVGRLLVSGTLTQRQLAVLLVVWTTPFLLALPIGSRDLWAYAAQGDLIRHGLNPYDATPADQPGVFLANVSPKWVHSTAPYGPLWLLISHAISLICGRHLVITILVIRLPLILGLVLAFRGLARLATRVNARGDVALWAVLANPLTLILGLGGGHNDVLMMGLMTMAAAVALHPGRGLGALFAAAALMTLAAAIKSPAAIGVAFVVPLWLSTRAPSTGSATDTAHRSTPVRIIVKSCILALASALATFAAITLASGFGLGWLKQVNSSAPVVNWLSVPTAIAILAKLARGATHGATRLDPEMEHIRTAGLVLAAAIVIAAWLSATYPRTRRPAEVVRLLAMTMTAVILLGPAVQPWYLLWVLPFVAVWPLDWPPGRGHHNSPAAPVIATPVIARPLIGGPLIGGPLIAASLGPLLLIEPKGTVLIMTPAAIAVLGGSVLVALIATRRRHLPSLPYSPDCDAGGK